MNDQIKYSNFYQIKLEYYLSICRLPLVENHSSILPSNKYIFFKFVISIKITVSEIFSHFDISERDTFR